MNKEAEFSREQFIVLHKPVQLTMEAGKLLAICEVVSAQLNVFAQKGLKLTETQFDADMPKAMDLVKQMLGLKKMQCDIEEAVIKGIGQKQFDELMEVKRKSHDAAKS